MAQIEVVNELLKKAWAIIAGNYDFILPNFEKDATDDNIMVTFLKIRIASEGVCRYVVVYEGLVKESNIRDPRLSNYIEWLNRSFVIEQRIRNIIIPNINAYCNGMAHYKDAPLSIDDAKNCVEEFRKLLKWFVENYSDTKISDFNDIILSQNMKGVIPPKTEGIFLSREKESDDINNMLDERGHVAIVSAPGTGKTELCKDYVEKYGKKYNRVYYIENPISAKQFVYELPFRIEGANSLSKEKLLEKKKECLQLLNESNGKADKKYLFIMDNYNCNDEEDGMFLHTILKETGGNVHVIITSINKHGELNYMVPGTYTIAECSKLYKFYNSKSYGEENIRNLVLALNYNLRAIKMVACFLSNHADVKIEEFLLKVKLDMDKDSVDVYDKLCLALLEDDSEMDMVKKKILILVTFVPPVGMEMKEFVDLSFESLEKSVSKEQIAEIIKELAHDTWLSITNKALIDEEVCVEWMEMSPIISETLFIRMNPNYEEKYISIYVNAIVENIKSASKLTAARIEELKPLINHISNRLLKCNVKKYAILSTLRDYYIAAYDMKNIEILSEKIGRLLEEYNKEKENGDIQQAFYREGIANLNVEEFDKANNLLKMNILQNEQQIIKHKERIAIASAHCAHALARCGKYEEALKTGKQSIKIREDLIKAGYTNIMNDLWISYYNYALVFFYAKDYCNALKNCSKSLKLFPYKEQDDKYVNYSSPLHLRGQIYLEMSCTNERYLKKSIDDLEKSRSVRIKRGNNTFWVAQLEIYLADAYERRGDLKQRKGAKTAQNDYIKAEAYADSALQVKLKQYKTENMIRQINELECIRNRIRQKIAES